MAHGDSHPPLEEEESPLGAGRTGVLVHMDPRGGSPYDRGPHRRVSGLEGEGSLPWRVEVAIDSLEEEEDGRNNLLDVGYAHGSRRDRDED